MSDVSLTKHTVDEHVRPVPAPPTFGEAVKLWARIGLLSFGGPAGQIALMHKELVDERRWIGEERFLHALNYCMPLPALKRNSWRFISAGCFTGR